MPDIETLSRHSSRLAQEHKVEEISSSEDEEDEGQEYDESEPLEIPEACLACGKEKVTHLTVPCRHACLCRACAMKMATGGRCKVFTILMELTCTGMSTNVCGTETHRAGLCLVHLYEKVLCIHKCMYGYDYGSILFWPSHFETMVFQRGPGY